VHSDCITVEARLSLTFSDAHIHCTMFDFPCYFLENWLMEKSWHEGWGSGYPQVVWGLSIRGNPGTVTTTQHRFNKTKQHTHTSWLTCVELNTLSLTLHGSTDHRRRVKHLCETDRLAGRIHSVAKLSRFLVWSEPEVYIWINKKNSPICRP